MNGALGDLYMQAPQPAEAEPYYRKELELAPDAAENLFRLGVALAELGRAGEALSYLQRCVAREGSNGQALFYLGKVLFDLDRMPEAESALNRALERPLAPKLLRSCHYYLAGVCRRLGKNEAAERHQALFRRMETGGEPAAKPKD